MVKHYEYECSKTSGKQTTNHSPAIRQIADIDFSEIYTMSGLKYREYRVWKDKEEIIIESVLSARFPSLDGHC